MKISSLTANSVYNSFSRRGCGSFCRCNDISIVLISTSNTPVFNIRASVLNLTLRVVKLISEDPPCQVNRSIIENVSSFLSGIFSFTRYGQQGFHRSCDAFIVLIFQRVWDVLSVMRSRERPVRSSRDFEGFHLGHVQYNGFSKTLQSFKGFEHLLNRFEPTKASKIASQSFFFEFTRMYITHDLCKQSARHNYTTTIVAFQVESIVCSGITNSLLNITSETEWTIFKVYLYSCIDFLNRENDCYMSSSSFSDLNELFLLSRPSLLLSSQLRNRSTLVMSSISSSDSFPLTLLWGCQALLSDTGNHTETTLKPHWMVAQWRISVW